MKSIKPGSNINSALDLMEAEDRAIRQLAILPPRIAAITAARVALELSVIWDGIKAEMVRRGDTTPVFISTSEERAWLYSAAASYSRDPSWECCPASEIQDQLAGLAADEAAFVACKVARWTCQRSIT